MSKRSHRTWILALVAAGLVAVGISLFTGTPHWNRSSSLSTVMTPDEVTDEQLRNFARAQNELVDIQVWLREKMLEAADEEAANQIQQEANSEMIQAIHRNDMEVEEFSQVGRALNNDAQLLARFEEIQREVRQPKGGGAGADVRP